MFKVSNKEIRVVDDFFFIVSFEQILHLMLLFLMSTLSKHLLAMASICLLGCGFFIIEFEDVIFDHGIHFFKVFSKDKIYFSRASIMCLYCCSYQEFSYWVQLII